MGSGISRNITSVETAKYKVSDIGKPLSMKFEKYFAATTATRVAVGKIVSPLTYALPHSFRNKLCAI